MVVSMLLYGCEKWNLLNETETRIETAKAKFLKSAAEYRLYVYKTHEKIWTEQELNMYSLSEIIVDYKRKMTQHLLKMNDTHIPLFVYEDIATDRKI